MDRPARWFFQKGMTQQLSFFEEPIIPAAPYVKPVWSPLGHKRDKFLNRSWNYNLDDTWRPAPGDIVEYRDKDGYALVNEGPWFIGWWTMAYVLEVAGEVALLYFPAQAFYDHNREWIGAGSVFNCYPASINGSDITKFLKTEVNPNVTDIYPIVTHTQRTLLEKLEPPKDLFGTKTTCNVKTHSKTVRRKSP